MPRYARSGPVGAVETITRRLADRRAAGRKLGEHSSSLRLEHPVVPGLARGGVPVAYEIARALAAPLDVLVLRKIGVPGIPGLRSDAVAEGGC
jgi:putative phosphoribosyl transferase